MDPTTDPVDEEVNQEDPTTEPVDEEVNQEDLGRDSLGKQLLPGFPDDFTLGAIAPKLPWRSLCLLASHFPDWLRVMQNRELYDARVVYGGLESLVVLKYYCPGFYNRLGLYSTRDGFYFQLPQLPTCEEQIFLDCSCLTLDGKIYSLKRNNRNFYDVYVLDLAGAKMQWKQLASTLQQKEYLQCAALDGKLYGLDKFNGYDIEVYDPKEDRWTLIEPMPHRPYRHKWHSAVGEELIVFSTQKDFKYIVDVYHPVNAEWRVVRLLPKNDKWLGHLFTANGNLHRMRNGRIFVLDMDTRRWRLRHHYPCTGLSWLAYNNNFRARDIACVGDELLFIVAKSDGKMSMIKSEGFGGKNIDITWHDSNHRGCPNHFGIRYEIYPIEL